MIIHYCIVTVPKTENSIRTIALPENTVTLLMEAHSKHPDSPLMFWCPRINGYWSPDSLRHLHKQMLAAAGVDKSVRFHDLRHTFSTLAIQSGIDAKRSLACSATIVPHSRWTLTRM